MRVYKKYVLIGILVFAALLVFFPVVDGQAFSRRGDSSKQISGYEIHVFDYEFMENNPSRVSSLSLHIEIGSDQAAPTSVHLSVDDGVNWVSCEHQKELTWRCSFLPGTEPLVAAVESVSVAAH